ncbi:hypothetical protein [Clostridium manihotivorum]|uniref:Lipoprotein n=1 Tax=Clostridium manihotivorum TaxID=2320868 RepID=A0A3R5UFF7_9CLOT|nr:hypothetical protein [Clostridium manihotivorum]QAA32317.1 hypothetical protein C1I91_12090 [Clostridium manihotivorum]
MKSRSLNKLIITFIYGLNIMFLAACSNHTDKSSLQQASNSSINQGSSTEDKSTNSQTNDTSKAAQAFEQNNNAPVIVGTVSEVQGEKITISKVTNYSDGAATSKKKNAPKDKQQLVTIDIDNSISVVIRTPIDKNNTRFDDKIGEISNIKEDSFVEVWGSKKGGQIKAEKIIIYMVNQQK